MLNDIIYPLLYIYFEDKLFIADGINTSVPFPEVCHYWFKIDLTGKIIIKENRLILFHMIPRPSVH